MGADVEEPEISGKFISDWVQGSNPPIWEHRLEGANTVLCPKNFIECFPYWGIEPIDGGYQAGQYIIKFLCKSEKHPGKVWFDIREGGHKGGV